MASDSIALDVHKGPLQVVYEWLGTADHKKIGLMYIVYALLFLVVVGIEAILMRIQLAHADSTFLAPQVFNRLFTLHGTTGVFFVAMPILFGFGNYLVPLMIGARDMAFPRLNAFSFWMTSFGGLFLYASFFAGGGFLQAGSAPDFGWFAYAPLTSPGFSPGHSADFWNISILLAGVGSIGAAVKFHRDDLIDAMPGHDDGPHAAFRLDESGDGRTSACDD